jgi:hypothetical protein
MEMTAVSIQLWNKIKKDMLLDHQRYVFDFKKLRQNGGHAEQVL